MDKQPIFVVIQKEFTLQSLNKVIDKILADSKSNARWSSLIPGAITRTEIKKENNKLVASIIVDLIKAPMARAFEFGSGIHVDNNPEQTYRIEAKTKLLKFPFSLTYMPSSKFVGMNGKNIGQLNRILRREGQVNGTTYWNYVDHPGVKARPFVVPAIKKNLDGVKFDLVKAFKSDVSVAIKESWNG